MAVITGLITVNGKRVLEVDADPAFGSGTPASVGSLALWDGGSAQGPGKLYIKIDSSDTMWEPFATASEVETYAAGLIENQIDPAVTTKAPSQAAVYTALAGKANLMHYHVAADVTDFSSAAKQAVVTTIVDAGILDMAPSSSAVYYAVQTVMSAVAGEAAIRASEDVRVLGEAKAYTDVEAGIRLTEDARVLSEARAYTDMESATRASEDIRILNEAKAYTDMEAQLRASEDIRVLGEAKAYTDMEATTRASEDTRILNESKAYTDMGLAGKANLMHYHVAADITDFTSAARFAAVEDQITYGVTDIAPSQNAVYTALAGKANLSGGNTFFDAQTFNDDVTIHGDLVIDGDLTYVNTQELTVKDPVITLNKGGMRGSACGFEVEEDGSVSSYIKIGTPVSFGPPAGPALAGSLLSWDLKAPDSATMRFELPDLLSVEPGGYNLVKFSGGGYYAVGRDDSQGPTNIMSGQLAYWTDAGFKVTGDSALSYGLLANPFGSEMTLQAPAIQAADLYLTTQQGSENAVLYVGEGGLIRSDFSHFMWNDSMKYLSILSPSNDPDVSLASRAGLQLTATSTAGAASVAFNRSGSTGMVVGFGGQAHPDQADAFFIYNEATQGTPFRLYDDDALDITSFAMTVTVAESFEVDSQQTISLHARNGFGLQSEEGKTWNQEWYPAQGSTGGVGVKEVKVGGRLTTESDAPAYAPLYYSGGAQGGLLQNVFAAQPLTVLVEVSVTACSGVAMSSEHNATYIRTARLNWAPNFGAYQVASLQTDFTSEEQTDMNFTIAADPVTGKPALVFHGPAAATVDWRYVVRAVA